MRYYMKSKFFRLKEDFWIKNENDENIFFVDNKMLTFGLQFEILKDRRILYTVKEKLLTFMSQYEILRGNEIVANVNQKLSFFKDKVKVNSKYGEIDIKGNVFDYKYNIYKDNKIIGSIKKEFFAFTDNYYIDIYFEDEAFILCLVVIIDNIIDKQRRR